MKRFLEVHLIKRETLCYTIYLQITKNTEAKLHAEQKQNLSLVPSSSIGDESKSIVGCDVNSRIGSTLKHYNTGYRDTKR